MILLDTQTLVWLIEDDPKLGSEAARIEAASDSVAISAISLWEISLLVSRRRLGLSLPMDQWADRIAQDAAIDILPVTHSIAMEAGSLPGYGHGDPGDCIVIATARSAGCPLMTADRRILNYGKTGHLAVIDSRR